MVELLLPIVRIDTLPEGTRYRDTGCSISPLCLNCPLPECRYDDDAAKKVRARRDRRVRTLKRNHVPVYEIAQRLNVSTRTVHRITQRTTRR